jgi:hypothetical protein
VDVKTTYRDRQAARLENDRLRVTVLREGGHIAEIADRASGVNPLWTPAWPSIEPSRYDPARHPEYGGGADAALLAGIMGHNLCLDMFGGPSDEEAAAGLPVHGEVSTARFAIDADGADALTMQAELPEAQLAFERRLTLADRALCVRERVVNRSATDRAIGWTQHVTLGPPFVEHGRTELRTSARRGRVFEGTFGPADYLRAGADFEWPHAPRADGGSADLRTYSSAAASSAYTVQQMDPARDFAFVAAYSPAARLAFGCVWRRSDFPWLGLWEENRARPNAPWNGRAVTWGLEFGASPFPETRRQMIERGPLFDTPTVRWIPARQTVEVEYWMLLVPAAAAPDQLTRPIG